MLIGNIKSVNGITFVCIRSQWVLASKGGVANMIDFAHSWHVGII